MTDPMVPTEIRGQHSRLMLLQDRMICSSLTGSSSSPSPFDGVQFKPRALLRGNVTTSVLGASPSGCEFLGAAASAFKSSGAGQERAPVPLRVSKTVS